MLKYYTITRRRYEVSEDEAYDREREHTCRSEQSFIKRDEEEAWLKFQELREKTWQPQGFKSEEDFLKSRLLYLTTLGRVLNVSIEVEIDALIRLQPNRPLGRPLSGQTSL